MPRLGGGAPILEGAGRRWFFRHVALSFALGIGSAEAYWRLYALPRRQQRDDYYRSIGVDWTRLVD